VPRRLAPLFVLPAAIALLAACGDSRLETRTFDGTDGAILFQRACAECHGAELTDTDQEPPLLHDFYVPRHHADISFFFAIRRGTRTHHWNFGDMPPVEGLTDNQAESIVAFIRETQRAAGIQ
jgi:mono/diheme cytochrome c family protein